MVLIVGFIIVCGSVIGGLTLGGGSVLVLLHLSEFVTVLGICLGVMVIASPISVLKAVLTKTIIALKGGPFSKSAYVDAMMMMYQVFMLSRKEGLMALEDHLSDPKSSEIFQRYPSFLNNPKATQFFVDTLRPIVDGRIKPEQLRGIVSSEIHSMREEAHKPVHILALVGDSFPGIGICAAVLGIILTMGSVAEGAEVVGHKVAAALTGTFLGVFGAYGFINPLSTLISSNNEAEERYFKLIGEGIISFANGMAPQMAIEMSRRSLLSSERPSADELESELKGLNAVR
ncbi:MAG: flagellar motor stator protein MotA [Verrucomicrobiae bacterium]|nr:flagellar motor stator protein MotA [Verrucomicrobiae bacterium]